MKIFIVEDDKMQAEMVKDHLIQNHRNEVKSFENGEQMLEHLNEKPQVILLDYNLSSASKTAMDGANVLQKIKTFDEGIEVVMYSGQDSIEVAVKTMKYGAYDYIVKNSSAFQRLDNILIQILKLNKMRAENKRLKRNNILLFVILIIAVIGGLLAYYFYNVLKMGWH